MNWILVDKESGRPVALPLATTDFRGDSLVVTGGRPPHKPGSTGRIHTDMGEFYPSVAGLEWRRS